MKTHNKPTKPTKSTATLKAKATSRKPTNDKSAFDTVTIISSDKLKKALDEGKHTTLKVIELKTGGVFNWKDHITVLKGTAKEAQKSLNGDFGWKNIITLNPVR